MNDSLPIFQALVDAGTRFDIARDNGDTVICVLEKSLMAMRNEIVYLIIDPYFHSLVPSLSLCHVNRPTVLPLSFDCARVMIHYGIPFDFDSISLPLELQSFIASHGAEGK